MFRDVNEEVGRALRSQNALSMLQPAIGASVEPGPGALDFTTYPWLAAWIGEFMYRYYDDTDDARRLFERILSPEFRDGIQPDQKWAYYYPSSSARQHLACIYYDMAVQAHHDPDASPEEWLAKLRGLASSDRQDWITWLLGTYLRLYSGADGSAWKPYFRKTILKAIGALENSNDPPDMRWPCHLIIALLSAGDVAGAAEAAAVFIHRYVPDGSPLEVALLDSGFANCRFICDGMCSVWTYTYNTAYTALYFCQECYDTAFCQECYSLLKSGALPVRKCNSKHQHVQLFPVPEDAKGVAVTVDGSSAKLSGEWLNRLKEQWS